MKMYPDDWRVRLTTAAGVAVCMSTAMMLGTVVGIEGFLPGGLAILVAILVAILLGSVVGQLVGRRLFEPSSVRPPKQPPNV